ncbi:hypothetical protein MUK42_01224 [Musa troglodytarum]|uniref:Uncharacterized protein n=1 Tax=Musa troglodytarum TaxID=320322 RepID=A0A9E7HAI7_9LILI|nr:hypothetical protein MUK42_01224 [Musa troglodytarum]
MASYNRPRLRALRDSDLSSGTIDSVAICASLPPSLKRSPIFLPADRGPRSLRIDPSICCFATAVGSKESCAVPNGYIEARG